MITYATLRAIRLIRRGTYRFMGLFSPVRLVANCDKSTLTGGKKPTIHSNGSAPLRGTPPVCLLAVKTVNSPYQRRRSRPPNTPQMTATPSECLSYKKKMIFFLFLSTSLSLCIPIPDTLLFAQSGLPTYIYPLNNLRTVRVSR